MATIAPLLHQELETYEKSRDQLLAQGAEKYVVIQGTNILGVWETYTDALQAGYDKCGVDHPFLVKRIERIEKIQHFTRDVACRA